MQRNFACLLEVRIMHVCLRAHVYIFKQVSARHLYIQIRRDILCTYHM